VTGAKLVDSEALETMLRVPRTELLRPESLTEREGVGAPRVLLDRLLVARMLLRAVWGRGGTRGRAGGSVVTAM